MTKTKNVIFFFKLKYALSLVNFRVNKQLRWRISQSVGLISYRGKFRSFPSCFSDLHFNKNSLIERHGSWRHTEVSLLGHRLARKEILVNDIKRQKKKSLIQACVSNSWSLTVFWIWTTEESSPDSDDDPSLTTGSTTGTLLGLCIVKSRVLLAIFKTTALNTCPQSLTKEKDAKLEAICLSQQSSPQKTLQEKLLFSKKSLAHEKTLGHRLRFNAYFSSFHLEKKPDKMSKRSQTPSHNASFLPLWRISPLFRYTCFIVGQVMLWNKGTPTCMFAKKVIPPQ